MLLTTNFLNILAILVTASYYAVRSEGIAFNAEADEENTIKQALFLVELLKSDFAKILRENGHHRSHAENNSTEDNSTCPTPLEDKNSTTANDTSVTVSGGPVPSGAPSATPPASQDGRPDNAAPPVVSWPPMPMPGYPVQAYPPQRNFPADENYRFPYRFGRRRMMPDYYYFDTPVKPRGNFRRLESNDPVVDLANGTVTTTQAQTTIIPSTTSAVASSPVEGTTAATSTFLTTLLQQSTSTPTTIRPITDITTQPPELTAQPTQLTAQPTQLTAQPTQLAHEPTPATQPTTTQSAADIRMPALVSKASSAISSNRKVKNAHGRHLRHRKTTTEKYTSEDIVMSQVASELINEFTGTNSENIPQILSRVRTDSKLTSKRKPSTTMKIYLKGSSRLPMPLPENNAFCHAYPRNVLCGSVM